MSSPTRVARQRRRPETSVVAAETAAPGAFATGTLSPVSVDSSAAPSPSSTTPSTGTAIPRRTTNKSPTRTCPTGTFASAPSRTTAAVFGARRTSAASALVVFPFARASRSLPTVMSVTIIAALSK